MYWTFTLILTSFFMLVYLSYSWNGNEKQGRRCAVPVRAPRALSATADNSGQDSAGSINGIVRAKKGNSLDASAQENGCVALLNLAAKLANRVKIAGAWGISSSVRVIDKNVLS